MKGSFKAYKVVHSCLCCWNDKMYFSKFLFLSFSFWNEKESIVILIFPTPFLAQSRKAPTGKTDIFNKMKDFPTWKIDRKSSQHEATSMCFCTPVVQSVFDYSIPPHNLTLPFLPSGLTARWEGNEQQNMPGGNTTVCALKPGRYTTCRTMERLKEKRAEKVSVFFVISWNMTSE